MFKGLGLGGIQIAQMLKQNHSRKVYQNLRITKSTFLLLKQWCLANTPLRGGYKVTIKEKLAIFIYIASTGASFRTIIEHFYRPIETIHKAFKAILHAMILLYCEVIQLLGPNRPLDKRIAGDPKYFPFFNNCISALDGTHIHAYLPVELTPLFRNRKGFLSQNVLAAYTFDLQFSFVYPGWEGNAHDTRVLNDAEQKGRFVVPARKFYLADAGYTNRWPYLSPYRGTRYHLREQAIAQM